MVPPVAVPAPGPADTVRPGAASTAADDRRHPPARHAERDLRTERLFTELGSTSCPRQRARVVEQICLLYLDLCATMAGRYANRGVESEDLVQVARLALVSAVQRYEPDHGPSFAAFAVPTISGELKRHFRDRGWLVRPPRRLQELRVDLAGRREELEQLLGRPASDAELAGALSTSVEEVREAAVAGHCFYAVPLETRPGGDADEAGIEQQLAHPDPDLEDADDRVCVAAAVRALPAHDRALVVLRFVEGLSQREIGERRDMSQMQVSRSLRRVLATLRVRLADASAARGDDGDRQEADDSDEQRHGCRARHGGPGVAAGLS